MNAGRCGWALAMMLALALAGRAGPKTDETSIAKPGDNVTLKLVNYQQLGDVIKQQRGKVVVVDFWADTWLSCKLEFPHLVEMHRHHAKDGLVVISVSIDEPPDMDAQAACLKFLKSQKAVFTNLILDEKPEVWQEKLGFFGPPYFFVFNREGKYQRFDPSQVGDNLANVEKKAAEFLKGK